MADRDRYEWERGRDYPDRDREYGRGSERERGYQDRGVMSRGADEVRSWFGDDEARRRRDMDEQHERQWGGREPYGPNSERVRSEHGWGPQRRQEPSWESKHSETSYGDQRDFVGRGPEWTEQQRQHVQHTPHWTSGARDYADEDANRRYGGRYSGSGGYAPGRSSSAFVGGYGAGTYESGTYESAYRPGAPDPSVGYSRPESFREGGWNWEDYERPAYNRDPWSTSEGRWSRPYRDPGWEGRWTGTSWSGPPSFAGRGPRNYRRSDDRVREDVNERLTIDPRIDATDIEVQVQSGEVTLSGTVDDRRTRRLAEEIIEDMPGVRDVRNDLRVNRWREEQGHRRVGEESRGREDGSIGHTGNPEQRDDVTTINAAKDVKR